MAWCKKCKYGSAIAKLTRCPMCGGTDIVEKAPYAIKEPRGPGTGSKAKHKRNDEGQEVVA